jgi:hypothetical protein
MAKETFTISAEEIAFIWQQSSKIALKLHAVSEAARQMLVEVHEWQNGKLFDNESWKAMADLELAVNDATGKN